MTGKSEHPFATVTVLDETPPITPSFTTTHAGSFFDPLNAKTGVLASANGAARKAVVIAIATIERMKIQRDERRSLACFCR